MNVQRLSGLALAFCVASLSSGPFEAQTADAQSRGYDRYGRDFRLHGNGFGRGTGGIYQGTRDTGRNFTFHYNGPSPFLYSPYGVSPYGYNPAFVSPGFYGGAIGPYAPAPGFGGYGYSSQFYGTQTFGPGGVVTLPPSPPVQVPVTPPIVETPVDYHVANSKADAERLRQMMRDQDSGLPHVASRPLSFAKSTPEQELKSVREEQAGDTDFRAGRYLLAYTHYKNAVDRAGDRAEPRAKLFVTFVTIGQYSRAVDALKELLQLDPTYPQHFVSLDAIYGSKQITKESVKTTTAQWAVEHVANPERLLVLAALMYFDGDIDRSQQLFDKIVLYDDLAPIVQGFLPTGRPIAPAAPQVAAPVAEEIELEIPHAEIDIELPPLPNP